MFTIRSCECANVVRESKFADKSASPHGMMGLKPADRPAQTAMEDWRSMTYRILFQSQARTQGITRSRSSIHPFMHGIYLLLDLPISLTDPGRQHHPISSLNSTTISIITRIRIIILPILPRHRRDRLFIQN